MSLWGRMFAAGYDRVMAGTEAATLRGHREVLIPQASGSVLEIGGGTGANLPFYGESVNALTVTEPEEPMARRLQRRMGEGGRHVDFVAAPAERLPFDDATFDSVVSTLVLCTVTDQPQAFHELHRVLKPGGKLLFMEHVRSDEPGLARWQDRLNWLQLRIGHGCNCNRPTVDTMRANGFAVEAVEHDTLAKAPPIIRPLAVGVATAA